MIDRDFCDFLECEIGKVFEYSDDDEIKGFWCDGVLKRPTRTLLFSKIRK
jgi:hypothetical protein